jgi:hypothetical protein
MKINTNTSEELDYFGKGTIAALHILVPWSMTLCSLVRVYPSSILPTVTIQKTTQTRHSENFKSNIE